MTLIDYWRYGFLYFTDSSVWVEILAFSMPCERTFHPHPESNRRLPHGSEFYATWPYLVRRMDHASVFTSQSQADRHDEHWARGT